jgi:hypothetical protein
MGCCNSIPEIEVLSSPKQVKSTRSSVDLACFNALTLMTNNINVYHNQQHAIDVADFAVLACTESTLLNSDIKKCIRVAALMHDVCHPAGRKFEDVHHDFDELCQSHLETMHAQVAKQLLKRSNTFGSVGVEKQNQYHEFIIKLIMATDVASYSSYEEDPILELSKTIIRCADLQHLTKDIKIHLEHVVALNNELNIVLTPKNHIEFIQKIALPQFKKLHELCNTTQTLIWLSAVQQKINYWKS